MAAVSGVGGYLKTGNGGEAVRIELQRWELEDGNRLDDTTTSASTSADFTGTMPEVSCSFSLLADDTTFPEASGLTSGSKVNLSLKYGTLAKFMTVTNACVERVQTTDDSTQGVVRMQVSCRGGVLARYASSALS